MNTKKRPRPTRKPRPTWNDPVAPFLPTPDAPKPQDTPAPVKRLEDDKLFDGLYMRLGCAFIEVGAAEPDTDDKEQAVALMLERQAEFLDYASALLVDHAPPAPVLLTNAAVSTDALIGRPIRQMTHKRTRR